MLLSSPWSDPDPTVKHDSDDLEPITNSSYHEISTGLEIWLWEDL